MDKLEAMRAFAEIVDRGSLTAAADSLGRSRPTIVRVLAQLEASLGVQLLNRTTRRMSLTAEGRDYLERVRQILQDVAEAEDALIARQVEAQGRLRVTTPVLFGRMHVAPAIIEFSRRHPKVEIDLIALDRVVDMVEEGIDAAIRISALADSSMIAIRTGAVRRVVVASPSLLEARGLPSEPEELSDLPCVRFTGLAPTDHLNFSRAGRSFRVPVDGAIRSNDAAIALEACAEGRGFGQFLSYQVEPLVRAGRLRLVLEAFAPDALPVQIVYPGSRLVSTRLRVFLDSMRDSLRAGLARVESLHPVTPDA